ncbi:hypothetical protein IC619_013845 [Hazenella sp. IB182353]|uniref:hypothetical protein n=1 Tax=Polycladospora coralii TaxID=2771432 RepID=UPI001BCACC73|nr:hypothetical protein [Polycladospora coralii]MBS7531566.1 hypothetical protein [Polycladospora coralii]
MEKKYINLLSCNGERMHAVLYLHEESPEDGDMVFLELSTSEIKISSQDESFFQALAGIRKKLEENRIQILCNGAALNVYSSPMHLSMGSGCLAYKIRIGEQAKTEDLVDIFDYDENLNLVGVEEQARFYDNWVKSFLNRNT